MLLVTLCDNSPIARCFKFPSGRAFVVNLLRACLHFLRFLTFMRDYLFRSTNTRTWSRATYVPKMIFPSQKGMMTFFQQLTASKREHRTMSNMYHTYYATERGH